MMDIVAKTDRLTCTARAKLVPAGQYVDVNGDLVNTPSSWSMSLHECTSNSFKDHLETLADKANVANGNAGVVVYDVSTFSYVDAVKRIEDGLPDGDDADSCKFVTTLSTQGSIDELGSHFFGDDSAKELKKLKDQGKIKHVISRIWDGISGDSEYCSYYHFDIYTTEGLLLFLDYDHTT